MHHLEKLGLIAFVTLEAFYYITHTGKTIFSQHIQKSYDKIVSTVRLENYSCFVFFVFFCFILDTFTLKVKISDNFTIIKKINSVLNIKFEACA